MQLLLNATRVPITTVGGVGGSANSPDSRSTRLPPVVTLTCAATLPSSSEISSVPSSRLLKRRSPPEFHVRNWKLSDMTLWPARPGSCKKLVALKKTGKVWVSTQEKVRFRCVGEKEKDENERTWRASDAFIQEGFCSLNQDCPPTLTEEENIFVWLSLCF